MNWFPPSQIVFGLIHWSSDSLSLFPSLFPSLPQCPIFNQNSRTLLIDFPSLFFSFDICIYLVLYSNYRSLLLPFHCLSCRSHTLPLSLSLSVEFSHTTLFLLNTDRVLSSEASSTWGPATPQMNHLQSRSLYFFSTPSLSSLSVLSVGARTEREPPRPE